jgi:hypothetical protein
MHTRDVARREHIAAGRLCLARREAGEKKHGQECPATSALSVIRHVPAAGSNTVSGRGTRPPPGRGTLPFDDVTMVVVPPGVPPLRWQTVSTVSRVVRVLGIHYHTTKVSVLTLWGVEQLTSLAVAKVMVLLRVLDSFRFTSHGGGRID